jgi:hypothetical protein
MVRVRRQPGQGEQVRSRGNDFFFYFYHISKNKLSQKVFFNSDAFELSCVSPDATYEAVGVTIESCCLLRLFDIVESNHIMCTDMTPL